MRTAPPRWAAVLSAGLVANIAANVLTRGTVVGPVLYSVANAAEIALAVRLLRPTVANDSLLSSTGSVLRFILICGLVAPALSAILGGATARFFFGEDLLKSCVTWLLSDSLGLLVFTPFFLAVFRGDLLACLASKTWPQRIEALALQLLVGAIAYAAFFMAARPVLFVLFPPMMLVAFRLGRVGIKTSVMVVAVIGCVATMQGHGQIVQISPDRQTQAHILQSFLAMLLLTCLPVAAEVTARSRLTERLAAHDRDMTQRALYDPLTGLLNRAGFEERAEALLAVRAAFPISMIAIDFDHFKSINDRWGHQAGDRALQHVAAIFQAATRSGDLVARLGGDEFLILLPGSSLSDAIATADRIRERLRVEPLHVDETAVAFIGLSMGAAAAAPGERYAAVARRADAALYEAKGAGRNTLRMAG